jgi:hypothetical protein
MNTQSSEPASRSFQVTDALSKWEAEAASAPTGVTEIRLDANERLLIPFTTSVVEVPVHYVDYASLAGYVRCNGGECLLCRIGRNTDSRDLLPIYDTVAQTVGVLAVSPNMRPQALRPQLTPVLQAVRQNQRVMVAIRKHDKVRYSVTILDLPPNAHDGAEVIRRFLEAFEKGGIDLGSIYARMPNGTLAAVPEVGKYMQLRGMSL